MNEEAYVNRKGVHTINVQGVCDADMKLLNVVAKCPGSSHNSFIWRSCGLHDMFERGHVQGAWVLGKLEQLCITTCSREHPFKIFNHCCSCTVRSQFFTERVINVWNSVPCDVIDFSTLSAFKQCIERIDLTQFCSLV